MDTRNVADKFKGWETDLIKSSIATEQHDFTVCMFQLQGDFNFGTVVRNANAFGAQQVFYVGKKQWDRRSAVGTHHYTDVKHYVTWDEFFSEESSNYWFVGLEQTETSTPMTGFRWPSKACIIIGEENSGLSDAVLECCDFVVEIPQYGSVRSLNAGTASGIAMYDYVSKI